MKKEVGIEESAEIQIDGPLFVAFLFILIFSFGALLFSVFTLWQIGKVEKMLEEHHVQGRCP